MKTNQLKLAALSLALILPFSYVGAVCKSGKCALREQMKNQVPYFIGRDASTPAPVATEVVKVAEVEAPHAEQKEEVIVVPSATATSIPVVTEEINLDDLDFDEEDEQETGSSWKSWALGTGVVALIAAPITYFLWKKRSNENLMKKADRLSDATTNVMGDKNPCDSYGEDNYQPKETTPDVLV